MLWTVKIVKACVVAMSFGSAAALAEVAAAPTPQVSQLPSTPALAPNGPIREFTRWDRVVRGFRREHHFALTGGYLRGAWHVGKFGALSEQVVSDVGLWSRAEYTYHLQIFQGFGYFLGSSLGATYTRTEDAAELKPPTSLIYPGMAFGVVYNISPVFRLLAAGNVNLERYDGLRALAAGQKDTEIAITMESYDGAVAMDIFATINLAIRIEGHDRFQLYRKPRNASDKPVNADLERLDRWYGAGIVYHML